MKEEFLAGGCPSRSFTVRDERRVPRLATFFNCDNDLRRPFSLLLFVPNLPSKVEVFFSWPTRLQCLTAGLHPALSSSA